MSDKEKDKNKKSDKAISLGPKLMESGDFDRLYSKGMGLIEEVAAYLDGEGRKESRQLSREAAFLYASESMRLTTKLMQMASWLLLQKAISEGEISAKSAQAEKEKIKFSPISGTREGPGWNELPKKLLNYIEQANQLYERVRQFDKMEKYPLIKNNIEQEENLPQAPIGSISEQFSRLNAVFGKKDK